MFHKKGVFLIYVLFTAVLISIFLITAVSDMHNSFFLTKKFTFLKLEFNGKRY